LLEHKPFKLTGGINILSQCLLYFRIFQDSVYRALDDDWCPNIVKGVLGDMAWVDIPLLYNGNLPKGVLLPSTTLFRRPRFCSNCLRIFATLQSQR